MYRRKFLVVLGASAFAAVAGCSAIFERLLDFALEDVNVMTDSEEPVAIRVDIVDADGTTVFEGSASFEGLEQSDDDEQSAEQFADVWETTGEYTVSAEVEDGPTKTETVGIEATDDQLVVVYEEGELEIGLFEDVFDEE